MRVTAVLRAVYGVFLFLWPDRMIRTASGESVNRAATVGRILGTRHVLQVLTIGRKRSRGWLLVGAAIDSIHALSMVGIAVLDEKHRWLAASDATLASGLAVNGVRTAQCGSDNQ